MMAGDRKQSGTAAGGAWRDFAKGVAKRLWGPIPWLLEGALVLEIILGKGLQASAVLLLLLFSAVTGEYQESRAKDALGVLLSKLHVTAHVNRGEVWQDIDSDELVTGDVIRLRPGDVAPADACVIDGSVEVDESSLTGEPSGVIKDIGDKVFSASKVMSGTAEARVFAVGVDSTYGRTADLSRTAEPPGRLEKLLFSVVRVLAILDAVLAVILACFAIARGLPWGELLPFIAILVIATVPVSMPSSFVVANSLEARHLADEGILVTGLTGIQEAAGMGTLLVDKTGTLTEGNPEVVEVKPLCDGGKGRVLALAASACDAETGNSLERAVTRAAEAGGVARPRVISFTRFDPTSKASHSRVMEGDDSIEITLGSPSAVLSGPPHPQSLRDEVERMEMAGWRVLAVLADEGGGPSCVGLIALGDRPREGAAAAIGQVNDLGVRVIMVTGDMAGTAAVVARHVGIPGDVIKASDEVDDLSDVGVVAEVLPDDKLRIVRELQERGQVVGMTGDGVNDAPALKQADVGIAVAGATDMAKASARIALTRPDLSDIAEVILSGRRVYRRMMTWTITKLSRTAELAVLLTAGYIAYGFFPVSLSLIAIIVVLNDLVTLTLGTDEAVASPKPESWDIPRLTLISSGFAIGWTALGLVVLWACVGLLALPQDQVSTLMFAFLILSAMETILMTRTEGSFWRSRPSKLVGTTVLADCALATVMALAGLLTAAVPFLAFVAMAASTVLMTIILDTFKVRFYRTR